MSKHAVVRHEDGHDWIAEVLPTEPEALEWAEIFRDRERDEPHVTYTVEEVPE